MKEKIAILADSSCDLPQDIVDRFGINILPLKVVYGNKVYWDRIDIQPDDVYKRMPEDIPTTSMPSPDEVKQMLESIRKQGFTHVLAFALSSNLSGTYQSMKLAASQISNMIVETFDTKTLSMGTGWMVMEAAQSVVDGFNFKDIISKINNMKPKIQVYYVVETLEYLRRGGRIGYVAGMLGEFLHFKPIISVNEEGRYYTYSKARGRKKSLQRLVEIIEDACREKKIQLAVMHGGAREEATQVLEKLKNLPNVERVIFSDISPALGVHTGPGLVGVSYCEVN
jgi:DegV family protein with EDD domain